MRILSFVVVAVALATSFGCGTFQRAGQHPAGATETTSERTLAPADAERLRTYVAGIRAKWAADSSDDARLDELEKKTVKAFKQALGQATVHDREAPLPASVAILALRSSPIKIRIEPIKNEDGQTVNANYVDLKDSYSDRLRTLQRKVAEQTLTPAESAEIRNGSKYLFKVMDTRMAVLDTSMNAFSANTTVATIANGNILTVQALTQVMASLGTSDSAADREVVKKRLARQKRAEALAAASMGMLAAFEAVVNQGKNPKALDAIAQSSLKAFPIQVSVSDDEAAAFLEAWRKAPPRTREGYERRLRAEHGDAEYDRDYKKSVDAIFAATPLPPAVGAVAEAAQAAGRKDVSGTLDAAAKAFPGEGTVHNALKGAAALSRGDAKGALGAALDFVPAGGLIKDGLGVAMKLLFPS